MFQNFFKIHPCFEQLILGQFVYKDTSYIRALVGHTHTTRKFGSFVDSPPFNSPVFITRYYSTYFITLTATETYRCYSNKIFFINENKI